jgi:hypothetical protein
MVTSKIPEEIGSTDYVYLTLYRLKTLTDEEKHDWFGSWQRIRRNLPKGIKIITEASSAFGTEYTGFTVYEGPLVLQSMRVLLTSSKSWLRSLKNTPMNF